MRRQTARWVRKAEADLVGARSLALTKPPVHDLICFHAQQGAEKYLKALVQEFGLVVPRTHNLEDLLILLLPREPELKRLRRVLVSLSRYANAFRYPGPTRPSANPRLHYATPRGFDKRSDAGWDSGLKNSRIFRKKAIEDYRHTPYNWY